MDLVNSNELTLSSITYPCTIPSYDSLPFELSVYSDSAGYITDTLLIYSNDQYNTLDTMEIHAGTGVSLVLDSAVAKDNRNAQTGIDYDDCVILYFNYPVDTNTVSPSYLDSILPLSNNHTWCDGTGSIDRINYLEDNTVMIVWFSTDSILPTVQVGDTIKPDSISIQDKRHYSYLTDNIVITGSFGPTGLTKEKHEQQDIIITTTFNSIQIENNTNKTHTYQITDITGRVVKNIEAKKGITKCTPDKSGIYFIIDNNNSVLGKSIIVR